MVEESAAPQVTSGHDVYPPQSGGAKVLDGYDVSMYLFPVAREKRDTNISPRAAVSWIPSRQRTSIGLSY